MPRYHKLGNIPPKRHTVFKSPEGNFYYEELFGTIGFDGMSTNSYHEHRPTMVKEIRKQYSVKPKIAKANNIQSYRLRGFQVKPENDYLESRKVVLTNSDCNIILAAPKESTKDYFYKNTDADEVIFIHKGTGKLRTMLGNLDFKYGDYLVIPRGIIYKLDFDDKGHNIELEVDHNIFENDIFTDNNFSGLGSRPNFDEFTNTDRVRTEINLDYVNPLTETSKLEVGLQARLFENTIDYSSDGRVINEMGNYIPTSTNFDYERNIYSAYASYNFQKDKWSYQLGLRAETVNVDALAIDTDLTTDTTTDFPFENDYVQIYPSAFVTYEASEKNSYQFSFSRRVDRPGVGQVNPIPEFNTPLISQFGNPELEPHWLSIRLAARHVFMLTLANRFEILRHASSIETNGFLASSLCRQK
mgnify:CR=1 FL=1